MEFQPELIVNVHDYQKRKMAEGWGRREAVPEVINVSTKAYKIEKRWDVFRNRTIDDHKRFMVNQTNPSLFPMSRTVIISRGVSTSNRPSSFPRNNFAPFIFPPLKNKLIKRGKGPSKKFLQRVESPTLEENPFWVLNFDQLIWGIVVRDSS